MIKERVQSELQKMGVNLEKSKRNEWVEILSASLTDESTDEQVSNYIKGFESIIKTQASNEDSVKSLRAELEKAKGNTTEPKNTEVATEEPKDETKEMLKVLMQKIEGLETAKVQESLFDKFKKDERNKNIPTALLQTLAPKTADEYESAVENINNIALEFNKNSIVDTTPPTSTGDPKTATPEQIKQLAKDIC